MQIRNITNSKGNKVKNQFIIEDCIININDKNIVGDMFQSYESNIAFIPKVGNIKAYLDVKYWDFSVTTSKYRNSFLNEDKKDTQKKIDTGAYKLINLN